MMQWASSEDEDDSPSTLEIKSTMHHMDQLEKILHE